MQIGRILKPTSFLLIPVMVSFVVWAIPGESAPLRGFAERSEFTPLGILILIAWYGLCVLVIWAFARLGGGIRTFEVLRRFDDSPRLELAFYWVVTTLASVGIIASIIYIAQSVSIWDAIADRSVNSLASALPGRTSFATLRYTTAIAGPVGVYLWQRGSAPISLAIWNVALLLVNAALTSRMSIIVALVIYMFLRVRTEREFRVKVGVAVVVVTILLAGLTVFNYVRNANFYEAQGVTNPLVMNAFQVSAYLGAPAQVSMGVATAIVSGSFNVPGDPVDSLGAVTPTFLNFHKESDFGSAVADRYGGEVSIADYYNANSAFADIYGPFGWWGLFYALLVLALQAFLFGIFVRYRSVVATFAAIILYGFAETWRLFMFNQGVHLFFLLVTGVGIVLALVLHRSLAMRGRSRSDRKGGPDLSVDEP